MQTQVTTVFERIPDQFVELYDVELQAWAVNFRKVGKVATLMLKKPVEPLPFSYEQRRIVGVRLTAELDDSRPQAPRMVVRPQTDADEDAIRRHVFDMRPAMLN